MGAAVVGDQIAVVALAGSPALDVPPTVLAFDVFPTESSTDFGSDLRRFVERHDLRGAACRVTLPPVDYDLKLVERPTNIPEEELADATRWLIRDLVEIDVESAAIAVLTIPDERGRARTPHMFVAAARETTVSGLAQAVGEAGLVCAGFEVVESAMLALESGIGESAPAGAMIRIDAKSSLLTLSSEGRLYLARPLRIDTELMDQAAERALASDEPAGPEIVALIEPLLLDVQRSLDYYESEYGRSPATRLSLLPGPIDLAPLAPALAEALRPLRVEGFALERHFAFDSPPPSRDLGPLALACGAALAGDSTFGAALVPRAIRIRSESFGLVRVLRLAAGLLLALGAWAGFQAFALGRDRAELAALEAQATALETTLASADAERIHRGETSPAGPDASALRDHRDDRLALLRDLGQREPGSGARFSSLLMGLARQDLDGIWLERIELADAGASIALVGRTLRAEDVPSFLRRLRGEPVFAGRKFRTFQIERGTEPGASLRFRIATRDDADAAPGDRQ
ncbi:MAG: PilN domain-containing protein [Myxococcota bacterium]